MQNKKKKLGHPPLERVISIFTPHFLSQALSLFPSHQPTHPTHPSLTVMSEASKDFRAAFDPEKHSMQDNTKTLQWIG